MTGARLASAAKICALAVWALASPALAEDGSQAADKAKLFASLNVADVGGLLKVEVAREWNGMDQLVIARGSFARADKDRLSRILLAQGFRVVDDMSFVGGPGEDWRRIDGAVAAETGFEREAAQTDQLKLLEMADGTGVFLFQSTGF